MWAVSTRLKTKVSPQWVKGVLTAFEKRYKIRKTQEISIVLVGSAESRKLNLAHRGKNRPTNVLSFEGDGKISLGEVFLCVPVIEREAKERGQKPDQYFRYILAHGLLHIIGFDHVKDRDAAKMEREERLLLKGL